MKDRRLPKPLQRRILDYYSNYFKCVVSSTTCVSKVSPVTRLECVCRKKTLFNEAEILSTLSLPLRNEIVEHSNKKVWLYRVMAIDEGRV